MTRWTTRILASTMAAALGLSAVAVQAQPRGNGHPSMQHGDRHDNGRRGERHDNRRGFHGHNGPQRGPNHPGPHEMRGAGPQHNWHRGGRVPPQYRSHHYVVNDWRGHRLSAPPRGYHWIQNGSDYLLVAIASGVIASMVLGNY